MRKHKNWLGLVMAVVAAIFLGFVAPAMADEADRHGMENDMPLPTEAAALENGKDRFQARCSYCHRPDGTHRADGDRPRRSGKFPGGGQLRRFGTWGVRIRQHGHPLNRMHGRSNEKGLQRCRPFS